MSGLTYCVRCSFVIIVCYSKAVIVWIEGKCLQYICPSSQELTMQLSNWNRVKSRAERGSKYFDGQTLWCPQTGCIIWKYGMLVWEYGGPTSFRSPKFFVCGFGTRTLPTSQKCVMAPSVSWAFCVKCSTLTACHHAVLTSILSIIHQFALRKKLWTSKSSQAENPFHTPGLCGIVNRPT